MKQWFNDRWTWVKENKVTSALGVIAVLALVAIVALVAALPNGDVKEQARPGSTEIPGLLDPSVCNKVNFDPNRDLNVVSLIADEEYAIETRADDLREMKEDPKNLALSAYQVGLYPNYRDWQSLVDSKNECLARKGVDLYNAVHGYYMGKHPDVEWTHVNENDVIPEGYYNSGMDQKGPVINPTPGVEGDRAAIHYTIKLVGVDKPLEVYKRKKCGNPQFAVQQPGFRQVVIPNPPQRERFAPPVKRVPPSVAPPPVVPPQVVPPPVIPPVIPPCEETGTCPPPVIPPVIPPCEVTGDCKPPNPEEYEHDQDAPLAEVQEPPSEPDVPEVPMDPEEPVSAPFDEPPLSPGGALVPGASPDPVLPGTDMGAPPVSNAPTGDGDGAGAPHLDPDA